MLLIWNSETGVQVKGLGMVNGIERQQCVPELLVSDLFDVLFRRVRERMSLHTLVFVCLWFAFCKREVIRDGKGKWKLGCLELVQFKCQSSCHDLMETSSAGGASRKYFLSWLCCRATG